MSTASTTPASLSSLSIDAIDGMRHQPKFAMDISLFRFAKQLRLLGCDVLCDEIHKHQSLFDAAVKDDRIIVTSVGKSIPHLHRFTLIGDLTFGKAFHNLHIVTTTTTISKTKGGGGGGGGRQQHVQTLKRRRHRKKNLCNGDDSDDEESDNDDDNNHRNNSNNNNNNDDDEDEEEQEGGYAAFLGDVSDPRKFHWVNDQDPETKQTRRRRRRLVGYNSDGESDYEYEDDKKSESRRRLEQESENGKQQEDRGANNEIVQSSSIINNNNNNKNNSGDDAQSQQSKLLQGKISDEAVISNEIMRKLTALVHSATPGSVAAIAANACNCALQHGNKFPHQSPAMKYLIVDIHANFKQMLSAIILIAGVSWIPSVLFTRCVKCNVKIAQVTKDSVKDIVSPPIFRLYQHFYQCPSCKNVFWGVDNGLVVNFKSARTTEYLRSLFADGADADPLMATSSSSFTSNATVETTATTTATSAGAASASLTTSVSAMRSTNSGGGGGGGGGGGSDYSFDELQRRTIIIVPSRTSRQSAKWGFMPRHIFSFPRKVKVVIFDFMTFEEMDNLVVACPMFRELVDKKKNGMDLKFVPEGRLRLVTKKKK